MARARTRRGYQFESFAFTLSAPILEQIHAANNRSKSPRVKPYAMVGSGKLTSAIWKTGDEASGWRYRFNLFRMSANGRVEQRFRPADASTRSRVRAELGLDAVGVARAEAYVENAIAANAVVMFSLEWCEFCWAVRKLLARMGIAFESVDLDSAALQQRDLGTQIRAVLKARTGAPTIPQIWIAGTHVGGATDLFEAMRDGRMQRLLADAGVAVAPDLDIDPTQFLPKWLHPRKAA
jgi:glutaredoxin